MAMFEALQDGIQGALKTLRGKGKLTAANMSEGLKLVEQSLLEADASYVVVKEFMERVKEQALGEKVLLSLDPSEQLIGIVHQELIDILGPVDSSLHLHSDRPTILMLCGLQGSGKTTSCGKLSQFLLQEKKRPMLVAADLQRPAAIEQLHVLGKTLEIPVYSEPGSQDPVKVCQNAIEQAKKAGDVDVIILDTAGRLAIDQELMEQLKQIDSKVQPDQVYFVVDGMTGQDAVNSAKAFNEALELNGVIMTKLDGDARGGALLSVKQVTGVPIKFIGTGEQLDALELFYPDRMAGRILGMGDIVSMVETAQREFDQKEQEKLEEKLQQGEFTLEDFRKQLAQMAKPGLMKKMLGMLPGMGELNKMMGEVDTENDLKRLFGIIDSMTPAEKRTPKIIDPSRRMRIATGAGVQPNEVSELIKQFDGMASMMKEMAGKGVKDRMQMMKDLQSGSMMNSAGRINKTKGSTGKRLSAKERQKRKKLSSKNRRRRR